MIKIEVEVSPEVIEEFGLDAYRKQLQQSVELDRLAMLARKINRELQAAGLSFTELTENARQKAWEEYKAKHLKHILP